MEDYELSDLKNTVDKYNEYLERAENVLRHLDDNHQYRRAHAFTALHITLGTENVYVEGFIENYSDPSEQEQFSFPIEYLFYDDDYWENYDANRREQEKLKEEQKKQEALDKERAEYERLKAKFEESSPKQTM